MADALGGGALRDQYVAGNGVRLHVVSAAESQPPVVLLHGFPEPWLGWQHQLPALAQAGLAAFAPDQRGYNLSDKPRPVQSYALDLLAADITSLLDSLGTGAGGDRGPRLGRDARLAAGAYPTRTGFTAGDHQRAASGRLPVNAAP